MNMKTLRTLVYKYECSDVRKCDTDRYIFIFLHYNAVDFFPFKTLNITNYCYYHPENTYY